MAHASWYDLPIIMGIIPLGDHPMKHITAYHLRMFCQQEAVAPPCLSPSQERTYVPAFFTIILVTLEASLAPPFIIFESFPSGFPSGSLL